MATLTNKRIKNTYDCLLKTNDEEPIASSGQKTIQDGLGNNTSISLGQSGNGATITGDLSFSNNDSDALIKSSVNGGAVKLVGNSNEAINPERGLFLGRVDNNGDFTSAIDIPTDLEVEVNENLVFTQADDGVKFDNGNSIVGDHSVDGLQIRTQNNDDIVFKTNGNNPRMNIKGDGKVGINEPSPTHKLELYDDRSDDDSDDYTVVVKTSLPSPIPTPNPGTGGIKAMFSDNDGSTFPYGISMVPGTSSCDIMSTQDLAIYANSDLDTVSATGYRAKFDTNGMQVFGNILASDSNAKVGIRKSNPSAALDVNGAVKATSLNVGGSAKNLVVPATDKYVQMKKYGIGQAPTIEAQTEQESRTPVYTLAVGNTGVLLEDWYYQQWKIMPDYWDLNIGGNGYQEQDILIATATGTNEDMLIVDTVELYIPHLDNTFKGGFGGPDNEPLMYLRTKQGNYQQIWKFDLGDYRHNEGRYVTRPPVNYTFQVTTQSTTFRAGKNIVLGTRRLNKPNPSTAPTRPGDPLYLTIKYKRKRQNQLINGPQTILTNS